MTVKTALITAAGRTQRHLPLQTIVGRDGFPRTVLDHLVAEAESAGIERVGVVVAPGDREPYRRAAGSRSDMLEFIEQPEPLGYGDAIRRGEEFVAGSPFLLMVSDHLHISRDRENSCASQLVRTALRERCTVCAVQPTHESSLSSFGAVGGSLFGATPGLYEVGRVMEKPTPTQAEQELIVPGMRAGHYLCFFGMHVLAPAVIDTLGMLLAEAANPVTVTLSSALDLLRSSERVLAFEIEGRRFDLQQPYGLLTAQLALALDGPRRSEILAGIVELLADIR